MEEDKEYIKLPVEDRCVHKVNKNSNFVLGWFFESFLITTLGRRLVAEVGVGVGIRAGFKGI